MPAAVTHPRFDHPSLDWGDTYKGPSGAEHVAVICPVCRERRYWTVANVAYKLKKGTWTGSCPKDRFASKYDPSTYTLHPSIDWNDTILRTGKVVRFRCAANTCESCKRKRYTSITILLHALANGKYTGKCRGCMRYIPHKPNQYQTVARSMLNNEGQQLYDAIVAAGAKGNIKTHRFVMAKALGRPLRDNELVDHMDGDKTNNNLDNLRIYIRGKNQPGSHRGYGTYYHEWQMAKAHIRELEDELSRLKAH